MNPKHRPYQTEDDFWRMRAFLRRVLVLNDYRERCWHVARLDYARWHTCLNCAGVTLEQVAHLWEQDGEIVAMMMPDGGPGEAHLMVHPDWRSMTLEAEMLALAEERLATPQPDGKRQLVVWADASPATRPDSAQARATAPALVRLKRISSSPFSPPRGYFCRESVRTLIKSSSIYVARQQKKAAR